MGRRPGRLTRLPSAARRRQSPGGPGTRARKLLVTNVINHVLPLIRYELTDEVTVLDEPNPGPWTGRRIADIEGDRPTPARRPPQRETISDASQLAGAVRSAATGGSAVDPRVVERLAAARFDRGSLID